MLAAFFEHESRFFLTGGAALAGFHLHHRETKDLDLFTTDDLIEQGVAALGTAARSVGAAPGVDAHQAVAAPVSRVDPSSSPRKSGPAP